MKFQIWKEIEKKEGAARRLGAYERCVLYTASRAQARRLKVREMNKSKASAASNRSPIFMHTEAKELVRIAIQLI